MKPLGQRGRGVEALTELHLLVPVRPHPTDRDGPSSSPFLDRPPRAECAEREETATEEEEEGWGEATTGVSGSVGSARFDEDVAECLGVSGAGRFNSRVAHT